MKNQFVVLTAGENHFFTTITEAMQDRSEGIAACKKLGIEGYVQIYKMPKKSSQEISDQNHFIECLTNNTATKIK